MDWGWRIRPQTKHALTWASCDSGRRGPSTPISCATAPPPDNSARQAAWHELLVPYYKELAVDPTTPKPMPSVYAFNQEMCDLVVEFRPEIVSFQFGLPEKNLLAQSEGDRCQGHFLCHHC